jgi:hypothetical protein
MTVIGGSKGGGGAAPRTPVIQPDTLRSLAVVEIIEAFSEGEIEGFATADPYESIELDGTPLKTAGVENFKGLSVDWRPGTQSQTYMPSDFEDAAAAVISVNAEVRKESPVVRTITDATTDAVRIVLRFAALYQTDQENYDRVGITVTVQIEVRVDGGAWLPADLGGRQHIRGKTESEYQREYVIDLKQFGNGMSYDVRVTRVSGNPNSYQVSAFSWETYSRLSYTKLRYPNTACARLTFDARHFQNVPSRGYRLKGIKVKVPPPSVYNPVARTYTSADWDGSFVVAWTRCPAWIFYDLITNARYGLGDRVDPAYQDKWSLFQIAKRCDALVPDGKGGQEPRYSLDIYIQEPAAAKQLLKDLASAFDAMSYWNGRAIYVTQDAPKTANELYVPGNVVNGRFEYVGAARQTRYTAALVQWNDPDDGFKIATEYVEDRDGIARYGYQEKQIAAIGCTSRAQAHRLGKRILYTGRLEHQIVNFSVGLEGLRSQVGNICRIADPLKTQNVRLGGRLKPGSTVNTLYLDAETTVPGSGYKIAVISEYGDVIEGNITETPGAYDVINVFPDLPAAPEPDLAWIIYKPADNERLYRIIAITENEDSENGFYSISATRYAPEKYAAIDDLSELPELPANPFINNSVVPPSGLIAIEGVYLALEGVKRYIDLSWVASTDRFIRGYKLIFRKDGAIIRDIELDTVSYRIENPSIGAWEFTLSAITTFGKVSTSITANYTLGEMFDITAMAISSLQTSAGSGAFSGRDVEISWADNATSVLGYPAGYAASAGGQKPWFRDFEITVKNGATVLRRDYVTENRYIYSYEKNLIDGGPRRSVTFEVTARDYFGRYSQAATLTASNPQPPAIATVTVSAGLSELIVQYLPPTDNDFAGAVVFLSTASGITPSPATLVYSGPDRTITLGGLLPDTPYYLRIGAYDAFGGPTDYVLTSAEYTKTINSLPTDTPQEIKDKLQTALNDPENQALVFEANMFGMRLEGTEFTPFIIGMHNNAPAVLLDADVYVTGDISASQIKTGRMSATEQVIIGNGNALINGDGSIIVYNGAESQVNRDFALFNGGNLSFQRYRNGQYFEYKSLRRVEYGVANSGQTVTLPGYWDTQPRVIVSPSSLRSYDATWSSSSQTWIVRSDNLNEYPAGSGIWEFDAVAELHYDSAAGMRQINSYSGELAVESWDSAESTLPAGTVSTTVTMGFSSVKGDGISTHGYYYRSVSYTVQGFNGSIWFDLIGGSGSRAIAAGEHGMQITASVAVTIPASVFKIRVRFVAFNTNGTKYTRAVNEYNYQQNAPSPSPTTNNSIGTTVTSTTINKTAHMPAYTPPSGWEIYGVKYVAEWEIFAGTGLGTGKLFANGVLVVDYQVGTGIGVLTRNGTYDSGVIAASTYNPDYWSIRMTTSSSQGVRRTTVYPQSITIYLRQMIVNSTASKNNYTFKDFAWSAAGASAIAQGSINWMAVGD